MARRRKPVLITGLSCIMYDGAYGRRQEPVNPAGSPDSIGGGHGTKGSGRRPSVAIETVYKTCHAVENQR
jgi:hypothetical protein